MLLGDFLHGFEFFWQDQFGNRNFLRILDSQSRTAIPDEIENVLWDFR